MLTFTQTSEKTYDRHKYKLFYTNGKVEIYEWYDEIIHRWITSSAGLLSHVEVIDRKKKK